MVRKLTREGFGLVELNRATGVCGATRPVLSSRARQMLTSLQLFPSSARSQALSRSETCFVETLLVADASMVRFYGEELQVRMRLW